MSRPVAEIPPEAARLLEEFTQLHWKLRDSLWYRPERGLRRVRRALEAAAEGWLLHWGQPRSVAGKWAEVPDLLAAAQAPPAYVEGAREAAAAIDDVTRHPLEHPPVDDKPAILREIARHDRFVRALDGLSDQYAGLLQARYVHVRPGDFIRVGDTVARVVALDHCRVRTCPHVGGDLAEMPATFAERPEGFHLCVHGLESMGMARFRLRLFELQVEARGQDAWRLLYEFVADLTKTALLDRPERIAVLRDHNPLSDHDWERLSPGFTAIVGRLLDAYDGWLRELWGVDRRERQRAWDGRATEFRELLRLGEEGIELLGDLLAERLDGQEGARVWLGREEGRFVSRAGRRVVVELVAGGREEVDVLELSIEPPCCDDEEEDWDD